MAPHSSTLAWKIPWMEEPGRLQSMGSLRVRHDWVTSFSLSCIGEGNGNPLQCSCLENPRDGGAWWAAIYGIAQSWAQLKQLSSSSPKIVLLTSNTYYQLLSGVCVLVYNFFQELRKCWNQFSHFYYLPGGNHYLWKAILHQRRLKHNLLFSHHLVTKIKTGKLSLSSFF